MSASTSVSCTHSNVISPRREGAPWPRSPPASQRTRQGCWHREETRTQGEGRTPLRRVTAGVSLLPETPAHCWLFLVSQGHF